MSSWQNLLSTLLSKLDNIQDKAANPFFSSRIPLDLQERIEQHIAKTGESKAQVFINALNSYLNHPVNQSSPALVSNAINSLIEERFNALEDRIAAVELSFNGLPSHEPKHTNIENINVLGSDDIDNATPDVLPNSELVQQENNSLFDNPVVLEEVISQNDQLEQQEENTEQAVQEPPAKFENLTSAEMAKQTGLKQAQLDGYKRKVTIKYQKMGQPLAAKKLLVSPEKIETIEPIIINGYPYDLFYLGQNDKGNNLWTALPS
jgi:hypothetical protein